MNPKSQRLFLSSLPFDLINQDELRQQFSDYGCVASVEVKERNNRTRADKSRHFAYVTIEADDRSLQKCLHELNSKGIEVQIAKESFMDRLKREREETASSKPKPEAKPNANVRKTGLKAVEVGTKQDRQSNENYADSVSCRKRKKRVEEKGVVEAVAKDTDGMKMESEKKRLQSISQMKKGYQHQKSVIQAALSNINTSSKKKTVFFDDAEPTGTSLQSPSKDKPSLFDDDEGDDDEEYDFAHKEHLEGEKGGRLLALQSKFSHDRRFAMNERFLDTEADEVEHSERPEPEDAANSYDEEKRMELGVLEGILGQATVKKPKDAAARNTMLRFDPTKPEHSRYEVEKKIAGKKKAEPETIAEETRAEVSKEQFYRVESNLKEALHDNQQFSLLDMFGTSGTKTTTADEGAPTTGKAAVANAPGDPNPFAYDSSESEDEPEPAPKPRAGIAWTESVFFGENDYRMQEGLEFIKRLKCDEGDDFSAMRRNLKNITRAKVRNTLRNDRPFRHKLGSNKRIQVKRALKR